jgi:hypothetical protein
MHAVGGAQCSSDVISSSQGADNADSHGKRGHWVGGIAVRDHNLQRHIREGASRLQAPLVIRAQEAHLQRQGGGGQGAGFSVRVRVYPRPAHSVQRTFSRACVTSLVRKSRVTTEPGRGRELGLGDREPRPMIPNRRVVSTPRSADDSTCGTGVGLCWYTSCKQVEGGRAER